MRDNTTEAASPEGAARVDADGNGDPEELDLGALRGAPPTAADEASPEEEGVFVELMVVGAPPATAR